MTIAVSQRDSENAQWNEGRLQLRFEPRKPLEDNYSEMTYGSANMSNKPGARLIPGDGNVLELCLGRCSTEASTKTLYNGELCTYPRNILPMPLYP